MRHLLGKVDVEEKEDLSFQSELFKRTIEEIAFVARSSPWAIERVIHVAGNDFFHIDNMGRKTAAGTQMVTSAGYRRLQQLGLELNVWAVDLLRELAPVTVMMIPGNHDPHTTHSLGMALEAWYRNCDDVEVVNRGPREYLRYGRNLIGWTHGKFETTDRLASLMPVEVPSLWDENQVREMHVAHYHSRRAMQPVYDEKRGVLIRFLPSLATTDDWHHERGFVGNQRCAHAFLWNREGGVSNLFEPNVLVRGGA